MAEPDHTPGRQASKRNKPERFLTVSLYYEERLKRKIPWIQLRGLWVQQVGFMPHTKVRVRIMQGCLVITKE